MIFFNEPKNFNPLFSAAGCLCIFNNSLLLLERRPHKSYPSYWGAPGGKIKKGETDLQAIIRELYEETELLQSADNLIYIKRYYVVNKEVAFIYNLFACNFDVQPNIVIDNNEHKNYSWFTYNNALQLNLVPDMAEVLIDAIPEYHDSLKQLALFRKAPRYNLSSIAPIESKALTPYEKLTSINSTKDKTWYASFGQPAAGKTTTFKAMKKLNPNLHLIEQNEILKKSSRLNIYLKKAFNDEDTSYFFPFQMEVMPLRFWQAQTAPDHSLVDETIFSTYAYSRALYKLGWLKKHEYQTFFINYKFYEKTLINPKIIYFFYCSAKTSMERIEKRGRKIEERYSELYLSTLNESFHEVASDLSSRFEVLKLNTEEIRQSDIAKQHLPSI